MDFTAIDINMTLLIICFILSAASIITAIAATVSCRKLYREYDSFMRGRDAESLEDLILEEKDAIVELQESLGQCRENMRVMNRNIRASFQKAGVVRYDAFDGMGGKMSFALALLDYTNTGVVLNCMHAREGCFLYVKEVDAGATDTPLGTEERAALEHALGYING